MWRAIVGSQEGYLMPLPQHLHVTDHTRDDGVVTRAWPLSASRHSNETELDTGSDHHLCPHHQHSGHTSNKHFITISDKTAPMHIIWSQL